LQSITDPYVVYASIVIAAIPTLLIFLFCQNIIMRGIVVPVEKQDTHSMIGLPRQLRARWTLILALAHWGFAQAAQTQEPKLSSDEVTCRWAAPDQGGGLVAIVEANQTDSLLNDQVPRPQWWRVKLKDGRTITNTDMPCQVNKAGDELTFVWTGDIRVTVNANLDGAMLRSRIKVDAIKEGVGLRDVVFPVVDGIRPLSKDSADDRLLHARRTGRTVLTPLTTGEQVHWRYSIEYNLQFTALIGDNRGLYIGDHDPTAAWKDMHWTPDVKAQTLSYDISHPVLNWAAAEPVRQYESHGDSLLGPFPGDWYDAARIYRAWAVTAPWSAKGPMYQRDDYPKWFLNLDYWTLGHLGDHHSQRREFVKRDLFDFPITITHDYGHFNGWTIHDVGPDYFPPKAGSLNYQKVIGDLRGRGARVVPYVMGWMWNAASDEYQLKGAREKGAMLAEDGESVLWAELEPGEENVSMCPASRIWREKLTEVATEFVQRYRTGGVYFDYFSPMMNDCHNPEHGHAMGGGDY